MKRKWKELAEPVYCLLACICGLCALIALGGIVDAPRQAIPAGVLLTAVGTGFGWLGGMIGR